jgi:hypothetical protein
MKFYPKPLPAKLFVLVALLIGVSIIHSCRKENKQDEASTTQLAAAKNGMRRLIRQTSTQAVN